jgi:hypothetical protein
MQVSGGDMRRHTAAKLAYTHTNDTLLMVYMCDIHTQLSGGAISIEPLCARVTHIHVHVLNSIITIVSYSLVRKIHTSFPQAQRGKENQE